MSAAQPPQPGTLQEHRRRLWRELATRLPQVRPAAGIDPLVDAAAVLETIVAAYTRRAQAHGTLCGATSREQSDRLLKLLGPLPVGAEAGRATVALEVSELGAPFALQVRGKEPSAVYESNGPVAAEPRRNRWTLDPPPEQAPTSGTVVRFATRSFGLREGELVVFRSVSREPVLAREVAGIEEVPGPDGRGYVDVTLSGTGPATAHPVVQTPTGMAVTVGGSTRTALLLDCLAPAIRPGTWIVVETASGLELEQVTAAAPATRSVPAIVNSLTPPVTATATTVGVTVTRIDLATALPDDPRSVRFGLTDAATVARVTPHEIPPARLAASATPIPLLGPVDKPFAIGVETRLAQRFLLEDSVKQGLELDGEIVFDAAERSATFRGSGTGPGITLQMPVTVYGNTAEVTEGETVELEVLGSGEPSVLEPRFELAKKPLIYEGATVDHPDRRSSLRVFVDGLRWDEVPSFFGRASSDRVYLVEQAVDGTATVVFGGPLPAGNDNVTATYRFGGTGSAAAADSIAQAIDGPARLKAVRQPAAGAAGTDLLGRERLVEALRQEALMLERAVSAPDFAARALSRSGVERAEAALHWLAGEQRVGVRVTFIGTRDPNDLLADLLAASEPGLPVSVAAAAGVRAALEVEITTDGSRVLADVRLDAVRALQGPDGLLGVRRIPIGHRVPLEHVHAALLAVSGLTSVRTVTLVRGSTRLSGSALLGGLTVASGHYLDFSALDAIRVT